MSSPKQPTPQLSLMPDEAEFQRRLTARHRRGRMGQFFYYFAIGLAILMLIVLFLKVVNDAFGTIAVENAIDPDTLVPPGESLADQSEAQLSTILLEQAGKKLRVIIRDELSQIDASEFTKKPLSEVLAGKTYDPAWANLTINDLEPEQHAQILADNLSQSGMYNLVLEYVVQQTIVESWPLYDTIFNYNQIQAEVAAGYPNAELMFKSWVSGDFLTNPMSEIASNSGIRTALLGTIYVMLIVIFVSLPIGVGAAIYLEEYASDNWLNNILETNIRNLAGVPSIIYGMLGLAVFVRVLEVLTSGALFTGNYADTTANGRTILSASLTLALLILPIIIINAQEALRAVPWTIREASFGLGATQWQTIWRQVLPAAVPGILTGTILSVSRAIGETAPLIVVGASTFIVIDPASPFSKFTVLPIQIWDWTGRPQAVFQDIAAAAILVLLVLMLTLNAAAIYLRNRYQVRY